MFLPTCGLTYEVGTCGNFTMYVGPRDVLLSIERDLHESTINSLALILEIGSVSE